MSETNISTRMRKLLNIQPKLILYNCDCCGWQITKEQIELISFNYICPRCNKRYLCFFSKESGE